MKSKAFQTFLYSTGGVIAFLLILLAINYLAGQFRGRADLTQGNAFTLSEGTRKVLAGLKTPVRIRYYASRAEGAMPVQLKNYARRVEDLLNEYKQVGRGKVIVEKFDPIPDSDAEDAAGLDGIEPQALQTGERFYHGLAVSQLDMKAAIAALPPERETLLEYDLTRAITQVTRSTKPVVGVMSALPVFGNAGNPMMQMQAQPAWAFIGELQRDYTVKQVGLDVERIDDDVKVLLVVHPRDIKDTAQFAIDQFVLRGGKLVAFVDSYAYFDQMRNPTNPMQQMGGGASHLDKLFKAWGVSLEPGKVIADLRLMGRAGQRSLPTVLFFTPEQMDSKDLITSQVGNMVVPFSGAFTGKPAAGLTQSVLVKSTANGQLKESMLATQDADSSAVPLGGGKEYPVVIRLDGKFKSAFTEKPKPEPKRDEQGNPLPEEPKLSPAGDLPQLKESANANSVVLVADADLLSDQASVQVADMMGQRVLIPKNGNLNFVQSLVELYAGDDNLINLRSRAAQFRPLKVVQDMQARAQESYMGKINELEESLRNTQQRINELQKSKAEGQQFIVSPEQKAELDNFRKKQVAARQELKQLRKDLRADTDALEMRTKVMNIALMPILVAIIGIVLALMKRRRVAAA